jgi:hypothetical protein
VYHESLIDVRNGLEVGHEVIDAKHHHAALTLYVFTIPQTVYTP